MSDRFGDAAAGLVAFSAQMLGWRPREFWQATPADLALAAASPVDAMQSLNRNELNQMMERERNG